MLIDSIVLPDGRLSHVNPFESKHVQEKKYATNGSAIVSVSTKQAGVNITLQSGEAGLKRSDVNLLIAHADSLPTSFNITLTSGAVHTVTWDYDSNPIEYDQVIRDDSEPDDQWLNNIVLRFITA